MGVHTVSKLLDFCYGHRILGHTGRCGHLHGHNARVEITCRGPLDELGMVVDFAEINRCLGGWIDRHWDHRMILQAGDPLAELLREEGEPVFSLDLPVTAENMAKHLFGVAREAGLPVAAIRLFETPDSGAGYEEA